MDIRAALMLITVAVAAATDASRAEAQTHHGRAASALWGDLTPGPHDVGYRVLTMRDPTRPSGPAVLDAPLADRGYPLVTQYWYPASPRADAPRMTFGGYLASGVIDAQLRIATPEQIAEADAQLEAFYERPFNFPFGAVEPERWARLRSTPLVAVQDAEPAAGAWPLVIGVGEATGNAVLGEYLASHGYVVALVSSPVFGEMTPAARMEWYVRDLEFMRARMRELPMVDAGPSATWGFSFAGMVALLAAMRSAEVGAAVSLDSAIFYEGFFPQIAANPFYAPVNLRAPFLHMTRGPESAANERLEPFRQMRYSERIRYLLNDPLILHQDFGTHGIAAAAVLDKRPESLQAVRTAQVANAEYARRFLDAHLKQDRDAAAWLAGSPESHGIAPGAVTVEPLAATVPAPTPNEFIALVDSAGMRTALARFHDARRQDPGATVFTEGTINALGYQLLQQGRGADAIELFHTNVELYPRSANVYDSLSEAYETTGDAARAIEFARRTLDAIAGDTSLSDAIGENLRRIANERLQRLGQRN